MGDDPLLLGLVWYMVFLVAMTCHEAAHALAAKLLGDPTAYYGGQVTLNPWPHMQREPFGMVIMPALSYALGGWMMGWASAPYDPFWSIRYPKKAALMALAGPMANLGLAILAVAVIRIGGPMGVLQNPKAAQLVVMVLQLNLLLFFFNLIPLPPLDGSAILQLAMKHETAVRWQIAMRQPHFAMLGLIAAWAVFGRIYPHLENAALRVLLWSPVA